MAEPSVRWSAGRIAAAVMAALLLTLLPKILLHHSDHAPVLGAYSLSYACVVLAYLAVLVLFAGTAAAPRRFQGFWNCKPLQNFGLAVATTLLVFFPCDLLLANWVRVKAAKQRDVHTYRRVDPVLNHSLVPNGVGMLHAPEFHVQYRINSLGMREPERTVAKSPNTYRILMLGDSYVEGYGVEQPQCFCSLLEGKLNARHAAGARSVEVIDGGVASYSPLLEYLCLKTKGLPMRPDLVMLFFNLGDLRDDFMYEAGLKRDGSGDPLSVSPETMLYPKSRSPEAAAAAPPPQKPATSVPERVMQALSQGYLTKMLIQAWSAPSDSALADSVRAKLLASPYPQGLRENPMWIGRVSFTDDITPYRSMFDRSQGYLARSIRTCREHGIPFVLVIQPWGYQVNGREWGKGRIAWGVKPGEVTSQAPLVEMERFAAAQHVPALNLTEPLRQADGFPLFFSVDGHWTARGHQVVAEVLDRFLTEKRLLPGPS